MAGERNQNIQDAFLNALRKKKMPVTIFLSNGVKLQGNITGFDNFSLLLRRGPQVQLVYKHTVATVVPTGPFSLYEAEEGAPDEQGNPTVGEPGKA